jgi:hypothetical protein
MLLCLTCAAGKAAGAMWVSEWTSACSQRLCNVCAASITLAINVGGSLEAADGPAPVVASLLLLLLLLLLYNTCGTQLARQHLYDHMTSVWSYCQQCSSLVDAFKLCR